MIKWRVIPICASLPFSSALCPKCGTEMKVISVIVEPEVIDRILADIQETGGRDPFEERGPPQEEPAGAAAGVA